MESVSEWPGMPRRYVTGALDLNWRDLAAALWPRGDWSWPAPPSAGSLVALSVRSAFDLLLQAWPGPPGEILVGAITHPDMIALLRHHGWTPLPIDLDPSSLAPDLALLQRAVGPETRAVLVTHLLGGRLDMAELGPWCERRGLILVEDCAQAFTGLDYRGYEGALASLFSFGPLKTSTALGGAIAWVRDEAVLARMQSLLAGYREQPPLDFLGKVLKYGLLHAVSQPAVWGLLGWGLERVGISPISVLRKLSAGFPGAFSPDRFRQRPTRRLRSLLARRLRQHRPAKVEARQRHGDRVVAELAGVLVPGSTLPDNTHWIFPVTSREPSSALEALRRLGFDGLPGLSNLVCLEAPAERPELDPYRARAVVENSVLVPVRPGIPWPEQLEAARTLLATAGR